MENRQIIKSIISIISVFTFLIVMTLCVYVPKQGNLLSSFAYLQTKKEFYMKDLTEGVLLQDVMPVSDIVGMSYDPYQFQVVNHSNSDIEYQILFQNHKEKVALENREILENHYLKYAIKKGNQLVVGPTNLTEDGILYTTIIPRNSETTFEFRMWLDWEADNNAMNKSFIGTIAINRLS